MKKLILSITAAGCLFGSAVSSENGTSRSFLNYLATHFANRAQKITVKDVASTALTIGARMAGKYIIDLSSMFAHEYGHALTAYFAGEKTHIFIGTTTPPVDHTLTSSNGFTIVGYPSCGATKSTRTNTSRTIEAASYAAGPLCGGLYNLIASALLKKCGLKESNAQDVGISLFLTGIISNRWINLIAQSALPISLATHTKTNLTRNILNLFPIEKGCDGYEFLRAIGLPETTINNIIAPGATIAGYVVQAYSVGILSSLQDIYKLLKTSGSNPV